MYFPIAVMHVKIPLSEMLKIRKKLYFNLSWIWVYFHIFQEKSWEWHPILKAKLIYISSSPCTHSLEMILCTAFKSRTRTDESPVVSCWHSQGFTFWSISHF